MTNFDQARLFTSIFRTDGNVGILALSTSVFGGMTIGAITALLFNKFKNVQLPN
jgi:phosphotransferase system  glucose/maltose/N-acetylglucosamine-specific IIC component